MINLSAYAAAPVATIGLRAVLETEADFRVMDTSSSLDDLETRLRDNPPDLLLLEVAPKVDVNALHRIVAITPRTAVILWFDHISAEYLTQSISLGVLGALSRNSSIGTYLECFQTVARGYTWIDREASQKIHSTIRVALAPRERHVVGLIAQGLTNKEIAWSLGITEGTVKVYLSKLFDKVGVSDRLELALLALRNLTANIGDAGNRPRRLDNGKIVPLIMPQFLNYNRPAAQHY